MVAMSDYDKVVREVFDEAMLVLLMARPGLSGAMLLTEIINQSNDALARLKEAGLLEREEDADPDV